MHTLHYCREESGQPDDKNLVYQGYGFGLEALMEGGDPQFSARHSTG
jgi:hypothetical protein